MITEEDDLKMMEDSRTWPIYPILPVKNYKLTRPGKAPVLGVLFADDPKPIVYVGVDIADLGVAQSVRKTSDISVEYHAEMRNTKGRVKELLCDTKKMPYPSFAELMKAGWVVD